MFLSLFKPHFFTVAPCLAWTKLFQDISLKRLTLVHSSLIILTKFLLLHLLTTTLPYQVQILLAALLLNQVQSSVVTVIAWTEVCFIFLFEFVAIATRKDHVTSSMIVREIMIEVVIQNPIGWEAIISISPDEVLPNPTTNLSPQMHVILMLLLSTVLLPS